MTFNLSHELPVTFCCGVVKSLSKAIIINSNATFSIQPINLNHALIRTDPNINLLVEFLILFKDLVYDERKIGTMWGETSMRHLGKLQFAKRARLATIELNNYAVAMVKFLKKYNETTQNIGFGHY